MPTPSWRQELVAYLAAFTLKPDSALPSIMLDGMTSSVDTWLLARGKDILASTRRDALEKCSAPMCANVPTHQCIVTRWRGGKRITATYYRCAQHVLPHAVTTRL